MNDAWGYDENADESANNVVVETPKALRDAYTALKKQNEELITALNADRAERTKEKISSVFSELGVPGAAELYTGEADPEKARAWAESMRAAFGSGNAQGTAPESSAPPALDQQTQQQYQAMTEAGSAGSPIGSFEAAGVAVNQATDINALIAAMQNANHLNG